MPLQLITGRANAGKTGAAHGAVRAAARHGRDPVLILPSEPDVARARSELVSDVPLGLRVATFDRHIMNTWALHGDGRSVVTPGQRRLLISALHTDGTLTAGHETLTARAIELLSEATGPRWRSAAPRLSGAAANLQVVIESYSAELERRGLVEPGDVYSLLAEIGEFGGDPIVLHRFTDLSASQERFLSAASGSGSQVIVTLPWEAGFAPTAGLSALVERLSRLGETSSLAEEPRGTDAELVRVGEDLFGSPEPGAPSGSVRFCEADGEETQADIIAAEVAQALERGTAPHAVAVVFRDPIPHVTQLRAAFEELGILADFDVMTPFASSSFGRALLHAVRFVGDGDVTALLGFVRSDFSGMPRSAQEAFEQTVRARGMTGRLELTRELERNGSKAFRLIELLTRATSAGIDAEMATDLARAARRMLGYAHGSLADCDQQDLEDDVRSVRGLLDVLEDAVSLGSLPVAMRSLEMALSLHQIGPGTVERAGHVQVASIERVRARRFDVLVLAGLNSGEFPRIEDDPFDSGGAAQELIRAYGASGGRSGGPEYERLLLYQAVTRPRARLVLVRMSTDSDGALVSPSVFWEELLDFYRPAREGSELPEGIVDRGMMECGLSPNSSASERRALQTAVLCGQGEIDIRVARAMRRAVARQPELADPEAREELAARQVFSVSEIEVYLACPLRWFYERVVSPRQLDLEFDARARGRLAHEMLRAAYELIMSELPEGRVTPANLQRALGLAEEAMRAVIAREPTARDLEQRQLRGELARAVGRLIEMDATQLPGAFRPALLEWAFGGDEGTDFGDFKLRGRIDRVDTDGQHAVVIDYKTGAVQPRAKLLGSGRVQAALYAEAVRLDRGLIPVGSVYWSLNGGKPRGIIDSGCLEPAEFTSTDCGDAVVMRQDIEAAVHAASAAVAGMRAGDLGARPLEGACDWCSATALCARCLR